MLKFVKFDTFVASAIVTQPGSSKSESFTCKFRYMDRSAFEALVDEQLGDAEFLGRVLVSVCDIGDADGNELPPDVQRDLVIGDLALSASAVRAFVESISGAGAKNAKPSRGR